MGEVLVPMGFKEKQMTEDAKQNLGSNRLLFFSVLVVFLASFLASLVQTSGGRVKVQEIKIPTQNG